MSIFDSIGDAFTDAGNAVASTAKSVAGTVVSTTVSGLTTVGNGWKDVFSGNIADGMVEVGYGMARCVGVLPPGITGETYGDIVGNSGLWAQQQSQATNTQVCFTAYEANVKANLASHNIPWNDAMIGPLTNGAQQMPWINMGC